MNKLYSLDSTKMQVHFYVVILNMFNHYVQ